MASPRAKLLPCPCCGFKDIQLGIESFDSDAVRCPRYHGGCGLKLEFALPDAWPKDLKPSNVFEISEARLRKWNVARCIKAWNRRVQYESP
jgi:hypothetical protein